MNFAVSWEQLRPWLFGLHQTLSIFPTPISNGRNVMCQCANRNTLVALLHSYPIEAKERWYHPSLAGRLRSKSLKTRGRPLPSTRRDVISSIMYSLYTRDILKRGMWNIPKFSKTEHLIHSGCHYNVRRWNWHTRCQSTNVRGKGMTSMYDGINFHDIYLLISHDMCHDSVHICVFTDTHIYAHKYR